MQFDGPALGNLALSLVAAYYVFPLEGQVDAVPADLTAALSITSLYYALGWFGLL